MRPLPVDVILNMRKKQNLSKEVLAISEGALSRLTDLVLVFFNVGCELIVNPRMGRSFNYDMRKIDKRMEKINYDSIKRAITNARQKGWIKGGTISPEGEKKLKNIFSEYSKPAKWQGEWFIVNFDIPEAIKMKRTILRDALRSWGFGKLQNSVWISPRDFVENVEEIIEENSLEPYVILSVSDKVGRVETKMLAEDIWNLSDIQTLYRKFIDDFNDKKDFSAAKAFFQYQNILHRDPQLPKELLPDDWLGKEANDIYMGIIKGKEEEEKKQKSMGKNRNRE